LLLASKISSSKISSARNKAIAKTAKLSAFDIEGYELVEEGGESYYKNKKDWMFNLEGDYVGHYNNNGRFLKK